MHQSFTRQMFSQSWSRRSFRLLCKMHHTANSLWPTFFHHTFFWPTISIIRITKLTVSLRHYLPLIDTDVFIQSILQMALICCSDENGSGKKTRFFVFFFTRNLALRSRRLITIDRYRLDKKNSWINSKPCCLHSWSDPSDKACQNSFVSTLMRVKRTWWDF